MSANETQDAGRRTRLACYGVLGLGCLVFAHLRVKAVERAVDRGEFARLDERVALTLLVFGIGLGLTTIALVIFG